MEIIAHLRRDCTWSTDFRALMSKHGLEYEITLIPDTQRLPYAEINGVLLADTNIEDIEEFLRGYGLGKSDTHQDSFKSTSETDEEREAIRSKTTRFF